MSAKIIPFPTVRRVASDPAPKRQCTGSAAPVLAPCRFTPGARNALRELASALPQWGVRFEEHLDGGGDWAALYDVGGSGHAFVIVAPEHDGRLGLYDSRWEPLVSFDTPAELVTMLGGWLP